MLKLMGAVLVFGACASLGLSARQGLRRRVAAADAMLLALSLIEGEIASRRTPVPEVAGQLAESDNAAIRAVFGALHRRLMAADGLSLGYHWRAALRETREAARGTLQTAQKLDASIADARKRLEGAEAATITNCYEIAQMKRRL